MPPQALACAARPRLSGSRLRFVVLAHAILLLGAISVVPSVFAQSGAGATACEPWRVRFVAVEGVVEYRRADETTWSDAIPNLRLCVGDSIRVSALGQASVQLYDNTMLNLDRNTEIEILAPAEGDQASRDDGSLINLLRGLIHIISRDPRSLRFSTPFVNAGLEGTEFEIEVDSDSSVVTVIEGAVALTNQFGATVVPSGSRGTASATSVPVTTAFPNPEEDLDWTVYYPRILNIGLPRADQIPSSEEAQSPDFFVARAASKLTLGLINEAREDLDTALRLDSSNANALAQRALMAAVANDTDEAQRLADQALTASPNSVSALLALSYAAQADADAAGAEDAARRAVEIEPEDPLAWDRYAEALVALGRYREALDTAARALVIDRSDAHARAVQGYAYLGERRTPSAIDAFADAVDIDPGLPLARIGLAIARAQDKDTVAGRQELEIAVALDPKNSLLRSYMAQLYETENRVELGGSQLELAKRLNPSDSTPWLYDALRNQQQNRPAEAILELGRASALEAGEPAYRSNFLLVDDLPTRSAGLGRVHRDTGFDELGILRGARLTRTKPSEYAGHRQLADIYSTVPRYQIARVNELYQSQLLQPINLSPVQAQLAEANLFILDQLGPSELAFSDLSSPVSSDGAHVQTSAVAGANNTEGVELIVSGLNDRLSYSAGYFDFSTDGFRSNNDFDQTVANALFQYRAGDDSSLLFELRSSELDTGDLALLFDPENYSQQFRRRDAVDSAKIGFRHRTSEHSTWIASYSYYDVQSRVSFGPSYSLESVGDEQILELQNIREAEQWSLVSGIRHNWREGTDIQRSAMPLPFPPFDVVEDVSSSDSDSTETVAYGYASHPIGARLEATAGLEAVSLDFGGEHRSELNPKLGLIWQIGEKTNLRASALETTNGPVISKFNIEPILSPTHVASFNQHYFGSAGEQALQKGLALDHEFSPRLHGGIELLSRSVDVPITEVDPAVGVPVQLIADVDESISRSYLYWVHGDNVALAAEYTYEKFDNNGRAFAEGFTSLATHRLPISLRLFDKSRLNALLRATYVDQSGYFFMSSAGSQSPVSYASDKFWILDAGLGYRFRNRRGYVSLSIDNLLDEDFRYQDTDPENPRLMPERMVSMRFTLSY